MARRARILALLLVALAAPSAAFAAETLAWYWTKDADAAKNNPWNGSTKGWNSGGPESMASGEKVYIAIGNRLGELAKKYITLDVYAPGAYSKMTVNLVGFKTNDDSQPCTTTNLNRSGISDTLFTSWIIEPQPTWERLELTATEDISNMVWTIEGGWTCVSLDWQPPWLWFNNANFAGPGTMPGAPRWTQIWIFPLSGAIRVSPPFFSAPPSTGTWSGTYMFTDPDGNSRPGGGVRFTTTGTGLQPGEEFTARPGFDVSGDFLVHLYRYDASTARYTKMLLRVIGNRIVAPNSIDANPNGSFQYSWTFYKGTGSGVIASYGWLGMQNVSGGLVGDCFCDTTFCGIDEGDSLTLQVHGQLTSPSQQGRVRNYVNLCPSVNVNDTTIVHPYGTTGVDDPAGDVELTLRNEPNPFAKRTAFHYHLREPGRVRLSIYDLSGRRVATVVDEVQAAGRHSAVWEVDRSSVRASGIHFARLIVHGQVRSRRIVITE